MTQTRTIIILMISVAAVLTLAGTQMATAQQTQRAGNLQLSANEVLLDIVVSDKSNKPVLDLRPTDLSVTDNGQAVTLNQFRLVNGNQQDPPVITLLFNRPGFTLRGTSQDTAQETSRTLRDVASKFLKQFSNDNSFQFAVLDVWGRLQLQREFTSDRKAIQQAIGAAVKPEEFGTPVLLNSTETKLQGNLQLERDPSGSPLGSRSGDLALALQSAMIDSIQLPAEQYGTKALGSLLALVRSQRSLTGRKAIVYFTNISDLAGVTPGNKQTESAQAKDAIQSIVGAANRAGVSIYFVLMNDGNGSDLGALMNSFDAVSQGSSNSGPASSRGANSYQMAKAGQFASASEFRMIASMTGAVTPVPGSLDSLARGTGGYFFSPTESLRLPVTQLISDLTTYYEASYVPPAVNDGAFHAVEVKARQPEMNVRARSGYQADSGPPPSAK